MFDSRYIRESTGKIWNEESYFATLFEVLKVIISAQGEEGIIPADVAKNMLKQAKYDIKTIREKEATLRHETVAFLEAIAEHLDDQGRRYIHYGLTSSDLLDTALSLKLVRSADVILENLNKLLVTLRTIAEKYKDLVCVGRTHGQYAEPYSLGLKFAIFYAEFERHKKRLEQEKSNIAIAKVSGSLGNYVYITPALEQRVAKKLGFHTDINTQIVPRDRIYYFMTVLAGIAASVEKVALQVRLNQLSGVDEWKEHFVRGEQVGSSSMPHKENPIGCENLCGLARVCRSGLSAVAENIALWHERDMSHSSVERVVVPQTIMLLDFMTDRLNNILSNSPIDENLIIRSLINGTFSIYNQAFMFVLIKNGVIRKKAHEFVRDVTRDVLHEYMRNYVEYFRPIHSKKDDATKKQKLIEIIKNAKSVQPLLTPELIEDIRQVMSQEFFMKHIDYMYDRIFAKDSPSGLKRSRLKPAAPGENRANK